MSSFAFPSSLVVVDVETTGLDPLLCSLLSIGAVVPATGDEFYAECRVWAGARIERRALEVNGCTHERCVDPALPSPAEIVRQFITWCHTRGLGVLAGMNPRFDREFLAAMAPDARLPFSHRTVDLHTLAYAMAARRGLLVPASGFHTDAIYALLDLPPEPQPHNALTGARREAEALGLLIAGGAA